MKWILYGDPTSGSATIELALAEIGAEVELRDVSLDQGQQLAEEYAAVNAQQKLPTLITPNGTALTESAAILITLAERYPDAGLMPDTPRDRALTLRWLLFMATELYPIIEMHDYPERFQPEGEATASQRLDELRSHARSIWMRRWLLVEQAAAEEDWFFSYGFSVVDIYAAVLTRWGQIDNWRLENLPRLERIAQKVARRDGLAGVWRRHFE